MTFVMGFDFDILPSTQKGNQCKLVVIASEVSPFTFSILSFCLWLTIYLRWQRVKSKLQLNGTLILNFSVDSQYDEKSNPYSFNKEEIK
ncbi:hypothetical protein JHK82_046693 [Glycine max]|uniref:Uncharacterized protein n=2 Tax=Glycine subgen. Soja TaxID=1462606 RepID=A0A0R0FIY0_SOYBN|nr:hypothetical protein JHK86_046586 [Glycine max]KAG4932370.1 hypothetical protein JHK87_046372 [Glycine soja]KAG4942497.1 hypothetical protein JHK85_047143 [Glycine max]KAG5096839.1 hypothetical protein JHK82_046693 [Glycine max]KAG5101624.1 hypothetical protein JHK84_046593 [Glycine max]